ncbi:MAG: DoxX family protein [Afipia sp.]|nr:DoxX family protein [Afipia sp.]
MIFAQKIAGALKAKSGLSDIVFRVSLSLIFVVGGLGHFVQHRQMLDRIAESPWVNVVNAIGNPSMLLWLSGIVFVVAGAALAIGLIVRLSALALFLTLIPVTIAVHIAPGHVGPFLKNIAILGALIHFMFNGSGAYAIDRLLVSGNYTRI